MRKQRESSDDCMDRCCLCRCCCLLVKGNEGLLSLCSYSWQRWRLDCASYLGEGGRPSSVTNDRKRRL